MTTSGTPDWTDIRTRYPAIAGCTYLNTASRGLVSQAAVTTRRFMTILAPDSASTGRRSWSRRATDAAL